MLFFNVFISFFGDMLDIIEVLSKDFDGKDKRTTKLIPKSSSSPKKNIDIDFGM